MKLSFVPAVWRLPLILVLVWAEVGCASPQDIWSISYMEGKLYDPHAPVQPCAGLHAGEACKILQDGDESIFVYLYPGTDRESASAQLYFVHNSDARWYEGDSIGYGIPNDGEARTIDFLGLHVDVSLESDGYAVSSQIDPNYTVSTISGCFDGYEGAILWEGEERVMWEGKAEVAEAIPDAVASELPPMSFTVSVGTSTGHTIWETGKMEESLALWVGNRDARVHSPGLWLSYYTHTKDANVSVDFMVSTLPPVGNTRTLSTQGIYIRVSSCGRGLYPYTSQVNSDFVRPEIPLR